MRNHGRVSFVKNSVASVSRMNLVSGQMFESETEAAMATTAAETKAAEAKQGKTITDSLGRTRRHSSRFNTAAMVREMKARLAEQNGGPTRSDENHGHFLEVSS